MELRDVPDLATMRPGRPRALSEDERRTTLIDAAEAVFLELGYHTSTMSDVATRAGMSKKTLYQVFPSKAVLFEALLIKRLAVLTMPIEEDRLPLAESLEKLLLRLAGIILSDQQIALVRLMVAEGPKSPEMVAALRSLEIGRGRGPLERWFASKMAQGLIAPGDPQDQAGIAFGMALGEFWCGALLNIEPRPSEKVLAGRIHRCAGLLVGSRCDDGIA